MYTHSYVYNHLEEVNMKNNDIFDNLQKLSQTSDVIFEQKEDNTVYNYELDKRTNNTAPLVINGAKGRQTNSSRLTLWFPNELLEKLDKVEVSHSRNATIVALTEFALNYLEENDLVLMVNNKK